MNAANSNVNDLARKFWDLWQEQVATIMNDKDFVQTLLDMMQKSPFGGASGNNKDMYAPFFHPTAASSGGDAATSRAIMAAVDECAKRLGAMERRLELLEAALIRGAGKPAAKPAAADRSAGRSKPKSRAAKRTKR